MLKGFREFIMRGNVVDLAVAVVIGAAFTLIINAVVDGLINPLIAMIFQAEDLSGLVWTVNGTVFMWGAVLGAVINFLAVAFVVYFAIVLPINTYQKRKAEREGRTFEGPAPTTDELLTQIRDLLKAQAR